MNMQYIFTNTSTADWLAKKLFNCITEDDLNIFTTSSAKNKHAILHMPFPLNSRIFERDLNQLLDCSEKIVILMSELHDDTVHFYQQHQHPKIKYFLCGATVYEHASQWMDWFSTSTSFYKKRPDILATLTPYDIKPRTFDVLLGRKKPHRTLVYDHVINNAWQDHVIMTYLAGDTIPLSQQDYYNWIWETQGLELPNEDINWTVTPVRYYGEGMSLSQIIPLNVYNQTAYTVVAETNYSNHYSFYTEKIVKPILAERLFLAVSGQHYLKNLREIGFKTFDGIIDESYDTVENLEQRVELVAEQMQYLINTPQQIILEQIKPITEHNKQLMLSTDWYTEFADKLKFFLNNKNS